MASARRSTDWAVRTPALAHEYQRLAGQGPEIAAALDSSTRCTSASERSSRPISNSTAARWFDAPPPFGRQRHERVEPSTPR